MNNKKNLILSVIGLLGLIIITVGVTFAFFSYAKEGTTDNTVTTGTITFLYTEVSGVGNGISLIDSYPISDSQGKNLTGEGKVFDFKVTSTNNMNTAIPYEITARKKNGSTLDEDAVKLYLTKVSGISEEEVLLNNYNNLEQTDKVSSTKYNEKTLYTSKVPASVGEYEQAYRLRMWIDEGTDFSPIEDNEGNITYPYNNKEFTITVNVYANAKVVTEEDIINASKAEISSISIEGTELTKVENQNYDYEISLPEGTTQTTLDIETTSEYATVKVERIDSIAYSSNVKRLSTKKTVDLNTGDNYFKVTVTSEDGKVEKEYTVKIKVKQGEILLSQAIFNQYSNIQENAILDKTSEEVNENGLFVSTDTNFNGVEGTPTYYFRGNVENYIDFAGFTWRVVRINEDGTIRLIMTKGINDDQAFSINSNNKSNMYMYYSEGDTARVKLEDWYSSKIAINTKYSDKVAIGNYYCEQAKTSYGQGTIITNSGADMVIYSSYTPNFKCETDKNEKDFINSSIGLLTYDEVVHAGGYYDVSNISYYLNYGFNWTTMSPAGVYSSNAYVWFIEGDGTLARNPVANTRALRPVINLKADTTVLGTGKSDDHWVVQ